jgi:hypothetical protein
MATIAQIRDGLATRLETIDGLRAHRTRPGQINPPCAVVSRRQTRFDQTFDGADDFTFAVTVFVQFGNDRTAQEALDAYLNPSGASSVVAAIHGDPTLGGVVDYARVVSAEQDGLETYAEVEYLAVDFVIEVGE